MKSESTEERHIEPAEAMLREEAELYRGVFESAADALTITDLQGRIVHANPAAGRMYGYLPDELIGLPAAALVHPDDLPFLTRNLEQAAVGRAIQGEFTAVRKDGSVFRAEGWGTVVTYQGEPHFLGWARDITERVKSHELLQQRMEERDRELKTLLDVSRDVTSTLELQPLLDLILDQLKVVVDYSGAAVLAREGDEAQVIGFRSPRGQSALPQSRFAAPNPVFWSGPQPGPLIIDDVRGDSLSAQGLRQLLGDSLDTYYTFVRSWMAVPMTVKDRMIGSVHLAHDEPHFYTPHHAELALAIAQQAAIAIENARLYEQARELAALEERQRLARELHDSVTQALYGIGLAAETTRLLLDRDPGRAARSNETVQALAQAGMAEMRALLFELRPESLELEGLVAALQKQARALEARHEIPIETMLGTEPDLPLPVKEALYRIGQEALHNAIKHAEPARVEVCLDRVGGFVVLEVRDDGQGFDTGGSFPGHLGLQTMRERAASLGGTLEVESSRGSGTCVRACIPCGAADKAG